VASVRDRQRAAARAKLEREMAARLEAARRRRALQLRIAGAAGGVLVVILLVWVIVAVSGGGKPSAGPTASASAAACDFTPMIDPTASPKPTLAPQIHNVGMPDESDVVRSGYRIMTINTNRGVIKISMDLAKAPCTAASMTYLADKKLFAGSSCHRLAPSLFVLQCGDPSGTGLGGPAYRVKDENLPTGKLPVYHAGDVAMANTGQPNTNGSQFFFVYRTIEDAGTLGATYTLWGHVIQGMDIIDKVAAGGDDGTFASGAGGGHPKLKLIFNSVSVGPVLTTEPTASPTPPASPIPSTTPSASATH
jgi:peptidyl-prolyl cis-trans isomerase B (cyclophilin B)